MSAEPRVAAPLAVGVIGTGRVGAVLGAALARAGHRVVAATGVSAESVRRAARLLPGVPLLPADEVVARADLVLLAVPDDELGPAGRRPGRDRGVAAGAARRAHLRRARRWPCWRRPPGPARSRWRCTRR